jgi:hypothetical protein
MKNRFQSLPFKRNLQRYTGVFLDTLPDSASMMSIDVDGNVCLWWGCTRLPV